MKYQVVPVLFFTSNSGEIKHIHVDSWDYYNLNYIDSNIEVSYSDNFNTMFSITPGPEYIYFNFDISTIKHTYSFSFPESETSNYNKLFIKFFFEEGL